MTLCACTKAYYALKRETDANIKHAVQQADHSDSQRVKIN